jgi:hypothetical protein
MHMRMHLHRIYWYADAAHQPAAVGSAMLSLHAQVIEKSLEAHVLRSDNSSLARECRRDMQQLNRQLLKLEHWKRAEKRQIRTELRQLAKEEKQRQQKALQVELLASDVLCLLVFTGQPALDSVISCCT